MDDDNRTTILNDLEKELGIQEKQDILSFRNYWSPRIFYLILGILLFQGFLVAAIGRGWLDFMRYGSIISVYLGESVVQVLGLGVIVLKFLFPTNNKSNNK